MNHKEETTNNTQPEASATPATAESIESIYETMRDQRVSELDIMRQSLEEQKKKAADYYDQLLRLKAEFENFRERSEKEKQRHRLWGKEEVLLKQIGLYDVLLQAHGSMTQGADLKSIQLGLDLIVKEFTKMLSGEGIVEVECVGKPFDPHLHEAMDYVETTEHAENTIVAVLQKGYMFNDRIIRTAKVWVAKPPAAPEK